MQNMSSLTGDIMRYICLKGGKWAINPPFPGELEIVKGEIIDIENDELTNRMLSSCAIEALEEPKKEAVKAKPKQTRKRRK